MGVIQIRDLNFSYVHNTNVLKHISLNIDKGQIVALLGPNGSGKTTFLKCLNRIVKPSSGYIYLNGKDMRLMKRHDIARVISYVPQDHKTSFPFTVKEIVILGRAPHIGTISVPKLRDDEICDEILYLLGIKTLSDRLYTELSGGERKMVLIARALVAMPDILLLDEPTAHLDIKHQAKVLSLIKMLVQDKKMTVIMTLHDPNLAMLAADTVILLKNGEFIKKGSPKEVITKENIEMIYDCKISILAEKEITFIYPDITVHARHEYEN